MARSDTTLDEVTTRINPTVSRLGTYAWKLIGLGLVGWAVLKLLNALWVLVLTAAVAVLLGRALDPVAATLRRRGDAPGAGGVRDPVRLPPRPGDHRGAAGPRHGQRVLGPGSDAGERGRRRRGLAGRGQPVRHLPPGHRRVPGGGGRPGPGRAGAPERGRGVGDGGGVRGDHRDRAGVGLHLLPAQGRRPLLPVDARALPRGAPPAGDPPGGPRLAGAGRLPAGLGPAGPDRGLHHRHHGVAGGRRAGRAGGGDHLLRRLPALPRRGHRRRHRRGGHAGHGRLRQGPHRAHRGGPGPAVRQRPAGPDRVRPLPGAPPARRPGRHRGGQHPVRCVRRRPRRARERHAHQRRGRGPQQHATSTSRPPPPSPSWPAPARRRPGAGPGRRCGRARPGWR